MKKTMLTALSVAACVLNQGAFAHTGFQTGTMPETLTTGYQALYNAFTTSHGCATNANGEGSPLTPANKNVIAASQVFPNGQFNVANKVNADGSDGASIDLSTVINGTVAGAFTNLTPGAVFPGMYPYMNAVLDSNGNLRAIHTWGNPNNTPAMPGTKVTALQPFKLSGVTFVKSATNCANSLLIRAAAAEWCERGKTGIGTGQNADIWIGHMTTKFNDITVMPYNATDAAAGNFYWPTLTIKRDLVNNPLDPSCGTGYAVAVAPTDTDIDTYLPITKKEVPAGLWPLN